MQDYINERLSGTAANSTLIKRIPFLFELSQLIPGSSNFSFLNDTKKVLDRINKSSNVNTQWATLWHINAAIKSDPNVVSDKAKQFYQNLVEKLDKARKTHQDNNVKTPKQVEVLKLNLDEYQTNLQNKIEELFGSYSIPFNKLTAKSLKLIDTEFTKQLQDLVILGCYLFQPALRNDWGAINITKRKTGLSDEKNYLYIRGTTMTLFMNNFKHAKKIGKKVITIRPALGKLLSIWLQVVKHKIGSAPEYPLLYLISNNRFEHVSNDEALQRKIPRVSERVLGFNLGINDYRILWETAIQRDPMYQTMSIEEKRNIHNELLHGIDIAKFYNKV